jgi:hypothetical protein
MSIIPASRLSSSDLARLGNNLSPIRRSKPEVTPRPSERAVLAAVNRSLASLGEQVTELHRPVFAGS